MPAYRAGAAPVRRSRDSSFHERGKLAAKGLVARSRESQAAYQCHCAAMEAVRMTRNYKEEFALSKHRRRVITRILMKRSCHEEMRPLQAEPANLWRLYAPTGKDNAPLIEAQRQKNAPLAASLATLYRRRCPRARVTPPPGDTRRLAQ